MKVLITGATGFLGRAAAGELISRGHELKVVSRDAERARKSFPYPAQFIGWDLTSGPLPETALQGVDAVLHLAGEPVLGKRWSAAQKSRILDSRVKSTHHLLQSVRQSGGHDRLKALVAGSAIGFYGDRGDEKLTETSAAGSGFLAEVCKLWEQEIFRGIENGGVRRVAVRTGVVLGAGGGAMSKLLPVFRAGAGGPLGSGAQWLSWIHLADIVRVFVEALENEAWSGVINGVAPSPVTNRNFGKTLGRVLHRPAILPAPALAIHLALGEMAHTVLDSQRVLPETLRRLGFEFRFPELEPALRDLCAPEGRPTQQAFVDRPPKEL